MPTTSDVRRGGTTIARWQVRRAVEEAARAALEEHVHFRGRAACFNISVRDDVLVVRGATPSHYLRELVQTILAKIDGVRCVHNQIAVINSRGLSSPAPPTEAAIDGGRSPCRARSAWKSIRPS